MKKISLIIFLLTLMFISCEQYISKNFGGNTTIELNPSEKLIEVTWKNEADLWILVEPMDSNYIPKTKIFKESSNLGIMNGSITFIESK